MALKGPGEIRSLNFNGGAPTVEAPFIEGFSLQNAPDSFASSHGKNVERGSVLKTVSATILDYSAFTTLNSLMTGRTQHNLIITYIDGSTQTIAGGKLIVRPVANVVSDVVSVVIGLSSADDTALNAGTGFTALNEIIGGPSITYDFPFAGKDGKGRPYFSSVGVEGEILLPNAAYAGLDSFINVKSKVAFLLPDGNWQVFNNVYPSRHYLNEDASQPRGIRLRFWGVEDTWSDLFYYHDGAIGASGQSDFFGGGTVEFVGFHYTEASLVTWG